MIQVLSLEVVLSLASGISTGASFDEIHAGMTHVLGWDVYTHELADRKVWARASAIILADHPALAPWVERLRAARGDAWRVRTIVTEAKAALGSSLPMPRGTDQRERSPLDTLRELAPGTPIIAIEPER